MRILIALALLFPLPQDDDEEFQKMRSDPDDSIESLVAKLASESFETAGKAADELVRRGMEAVPALEKALQSENADQRAWAERILGRIRAFDKWARALLEKLASTDDEEREAAEAALRKLGRRVLPYLREAARSEDKNLRRRAEKLLAELGFGGTTIGEGGGGRLGTRLGERKNLVLRGGGGADTEDAVLLALRWLARHQSPDGSWKTRDFASQCREEKCAPNPGLADHAGGVTGLAVLAFLGAGYSHLSKDRRDGIVFGDVVRRGMQWMMSHQDREGCIGSRDHNQYMYHHLLCATALVEAYALTGSNLFKENAQKAVDFAIAAQNPDRGWRYSFRCGDNDSSVTGWAVQLLHAAQIAGLSFPKPALDGVRKWFDDVTEDLYYRVGYTHRNTGKVFVQNQNENFDHHETLTAMGMLARTFLDRDKRDPRLSGGAQLLVRDLPAWKDNLIDFYYWHAATHALFHFDGPSGPQWTQWNKALKDALAKNQNLKSSGCKAGSWEPVDRWSFAGGRVYATALNALTLETYYRYANAFGNK